MSDKSGDFILPLGENNTSFNHNKELFSDDTFSIGPGNLSHSLVLSIEGKWKVMFDFNVLGKTTFVCAVCQETTTKYVHYEARVCLGCRAFFRRLSMTEKYKLYQCQGKNQGSCQLKGLRTHQQLCKACRYAKCLKVGMQLNKHKQENYKPLPQLLATNPKSMVTTFDALIIEHVVGGF